MTRDRCRSCGRAFAFDPKDTPSNPNKVTDKRFQSIIRNVSARETISFTERQVYYEFDGQVHRWRHRFGRIFRRARRARTDPALVRRYCYRWRGVHGTIPGLLGGVPGVDVLPVPPWPDLTSYSFERVLVTESAEVAAMLVANNVHFEQNCAILSADGYPVGLADSLLAMLRRNPRLQVYVVHDASPAGCSLPLTLRQADWFPGDGTTVFDLGLLPRHVLARRLYSVTGAPAALPDTISQKLTPRETTWLEQGNTSELEAIRPSLLIRGIVRGFARRLEDEPGVEPRRRDDSVWIFGDDTDAYTSENFG